MSMTEIAILVGIMQAFATICLGGLAAWIAIQQVKLKRSGLRLELYERRYEMYYAIANFIQAVTAKADMTLDENFELLRLTRQARFLFDGEIVPFIEEIRKRAIHVRTFAKLYEAGELQKHENFSQRVDRNAADLEWIDGQRDRLDDLFLPYLKFGKAHI